MTRDNLRAAFHRAARGKRGQSMVRKYAGGLEARLAEMSRQLRDNSFPLGSFRQFVIRDPKERIITAPVFEERVLHHAILNVCEPVFDRWLIDDTYACRRNKGREAAVRRAAELTRRNAWFLKLDVRKYFDSVPHDRLLELLQGRFKDRRLLDLLERIVSAFRGATGRGLPIGSLTSQHFANFYLGGFDRFVKQELRLPAYVRYMDDMVLWHNDLAAVREMADRCTADLHDRLGLELKPVVQQRTASGLEFLGCRLFPTHTILNRRSRRRWQRRVRLLERTGRLGILTEREVQARLEAATAFAASADAKSWRFRQAVLQRLTVSGP